MGATPTYSLPYPELDEPDDVPTDMRELATAVEALPPLGYWAKSGTTLVAPAAVAAPQGLLVGSAAQQGYAIDSMFGDVGGRQALRLGVNGDAQPRFAAMSGGQLNWGPGGATAVDTNLHRAGVATLQTDGSFVATVDLQAYGGSFVDLGGTGRRLYFGAAYDASLYRSAAGTLRTDGVLQVGGTMYAAMGATPGNGFVHYAATLPGYNAFSVLKQGDSQYTWQVSDTGTVAWGPGGTTTPDTNLYRTAPATLRTGGQFQAIGGVVSGSGTGQIWLNTNAAIYFSDLADTYIYRSAALQLATNGELTARVGANAVTIGAIGPGYGMLVAGDTSLYRLQAGWLKTGAFWTTGEIVSEGQLSLIGGTNLAKIVFGNAADTSLYRIGAGQLATNGLFAAGQQVYANFGVASQIQLANDGAIYFGSANDTKLYRSGVGALATTGTLAVGSTLISNGFTVAGDTNLYRVAATYLKTDGSLIVGGKLRLGTWAGANASAALIARIPIYDVNETQAGYLHVYDS